MTGRLGNRCLISTSQLQAVHARYVDVGEGRDKRWGDFPSKPIHASAPKAAKCICGGSQGEDRCRNRSSTAGLVEDQDAYATRRLPHGQTRNHDAASAIVAP